MHFVAHVGPTLFTTHAGLGLPALSGRDSPVHLHVPQVSLSEVMGGECSALMDSLEGTVALADASNRTASPASDDPGGQATAEAGGGTAESGVSNARSAVWAEAVVYELLRRDPAVAAGGWAVEWTSSREATRAAPYDILLTRGDEGGIGAVRGATGGRYESGQGRKGDKCGVKAGRLRYGVVRGRLDGGESEGMHAHKVRGCLWGTSGPNFVQAVHLPALGSQPRGHLHGPYLNTTKLPYPRLPPAPAPHYIRGAGVRTAGTRVCGGQEHHQRKQAQL